MPLSSLQENLRSHPQEPRHDTRERSTDSSRPARANLPKRHCTDTESSPSDDSQHSQKNAARIEQNIKEGKFAPVPAPEEDAIEIDEICIRLSPSFWVWIAVSRLVGQVLGFVFGDRTDAMLPILWGDVPTDYRDKPVYTDELGAYGRFFPKSQHRPSKKGSGETNHSEGWNTKWRQRQSGLVRESCGVHVGTEDDLVERFLILVEGHNQDCEQRWLRKQRSLTTTA
jgi:IS1 family transposase